MAPHRLAAVAVALAAVAGCATTTPTTAAPAPGSSTATTATTTTATTTTTTEESTDVQVTLTAGDTVLTATLADTAPARALLAQLPLELPVEDHGGSEKIVYPPQPLPDDGAGHRPVAGDLAYYAPWGNVVLYVADGVASSQLVLLGHLDGDLAALRSVPAGTTLRLALP